MNLRARLDRVEKKLLPAPEVEITVTKGEGGCPPPEEKARIRAANPDTQYIWICDCKICNPELFIQRKANEKKS